MATMYPLDAIPLPVREAMQFCGSCEPLRKPRASVCDYHDGWWEGWEAGWESRDARGDKAP